MLSIIVDVLEFSESHTEDYIGQHLSELIINWDIDADTIAAIVTESSTNIVKAIREIFGVNKHIAC